MSAVALRGYAWLSARERTRQARACMARPLINDAHFNVKMPSVLREKLVVLAAGRGRSVNAEVREAGARHIEREAQPDRSLETAPARGPKPGRRESSCVGRGGRQS